MPTTRTRLALPVDGYTLHFIGDTHAGGINPFRFNMIHTDMRLAALVPAATIQVGDNTDNGLAAENTTFSNFVSRFTWPWYNTMGNHDGFNQTEAQWATQWQRSGSNYTVDLPNLRLIFTTGTTGLGGLAAGTLTFLDSALAGTSNPCFLIEHYPPWGSCGGDTVNEFVSTENSFYCYKIGGVTTNSSDILSVIAAHSNFKAWFCGHTHSHFTVPQAVTWMNAGSVRFAVINCSSPHYAGRATSHYNDGPYDAIQSCFATWYPGDRIDVRFRDHGAGQWLAPNGQYVMSVTGL